MTLKEDLFSLFKQCYSGKEMAVKIIELCQVVNLDNSPEFWQYREREIRQGYEGLPVCGGPTGLYLLKTEDERREQIALRMKLIYAHFRKIKIL